jgi:hypothetical protein
MTNGFPNDNTTKYTVGASDKDPISKTILDGMIVGPDHPMFRPSDTLDSNIDKKHFPKIVVPPGSTFHPISPFDQAPSSRSHKDTKFLTGNPDNDQYPPPGII